MAAKGYIWGQPVEGLMVEEEEEGGGGGGGGGSSEEEEALSSGRRGLMVEEDGIGGRGRRRRRKGFDVIILADLIFNRSEHDKLLWTCRECLKEEGVVWVTYSHHDPHKREKDLVFFTKAVEEEYGFDIVRVGQVQMVDLFREEDGLDEERGVVYVCQLKKKKRRKEDEDDEDKGARCAPKGSSLSSSPSCVVKNDCDDHHTTMAESRSSSSTREEIEEAL